MSIQSFTNNEYIQVVDRLGNIGYGVDNRRYHQAMIKIQLHLLGRNDDICCMKKTYLQQSIQFPDYVMVKMTWSKNVLTEQLVLGAMNTKYCPVLGIALFSEKWLRGG